MTDRQVTCVTPDGADRDRRIDALGGSGWYGSIDEVIRSIDGGNTFWVSVRGMRDDVVVDSRSNGTRYLKTRGDGYEPNNLLALNACAMSAA